MLNPFASRKSTIRASYSTSLFVALSVRTIAYFKVSPINGVSTNPAIDPSLEDDQFVCNSMFYFIP